MWDDIPCVRNGLMAVLKSFNIHYASEWTLKATQERERNCERKVSRGVQGQGHTFKVGYGPSPHLRPVPRVPLYNAWQGEVNEGKGVEELTWDSNSANCLLKAESQLKACWKPAESAVRLFGFPLAVVRPVSRCGSAEGGAVAECVPHLLPRYYSCSCSSLCAVFRGSFRCVGIFVYVRQVSLQFLVIFTINHHSSNHALRVASSVPRDDQCDILFWRESSAYL